MTEEVGRTVATPPFPVRHAEHRLGARRDGQNSDRVPGIGSAPERKCVA